MLVGGWRGCLATLAGRHSDKWFNCSDCYIENCWLESSERLSGRLTTPVLILADDVGFNQAFKARAEEQAQMGGVESVKNTPHLIV
jgi:hypothetical protein